MPNDKFVLTNGSYYVRLKKGLDPSSGAKLVKSNKDATTFENYGSANAALALLLILKIADVSDFFIETKWMK